MVEMDKQKMAILLPVELQNMSFILFTKEVLLLILFL